MPRGFTSKVKVHDELIPVNPDTVFRRISLLKKSDGELQTYFNLSWPLFHCHSLMKEDCARPKYVDIAKKHFNERASIVFYGYPEDTEKSTKSVERIRRTKKHIVSYIRFDESMPATMSQEKFLSNDKNKQRLINMLCVKVQKGFVVKQAQKDDDYLIIKSALEIEKKVRSQFVVVFDEDIDLLVIMTAFTNSENIFLLKPGKGKARDALYFEATLSIALYNKGQYFVSSCVQWLRYHIC
ncbi:hypothetical protein AVEN_173193-1 [Araneus ventricosus]|uniref:Uncharacterized protein n=1 Tax=Araneus ventricosus TaxID=182803 RepID=A0A4Y2SF42_ARAVE|nr:hypothetical protein AVEN_173193-1 [Araneus ventricosus]